MKYDYENAYLRDAKKLPDSVISLLQNIILSVREAKKLQDIPNLKKLSGYKNAYRIRIGDYRIGLYVEGKYWCLPESCPVKKSIAFFLNLPI
ncbi:type II toxin-antitoxin system RelE family toxin [Runella sp.]|uniref:type II toxin-antitoxin system RelE family toxin n=1 Tax=Runella sp. TaxID=1960881 RepID=UPI003D0E751C